MMNLKLGKLPAKFGPKDFRLKNYLMPNLPPIPKEYTHADMIADWGMLGNDRWGDCTCAGAAHEHMLWSAEGEQPIGFNDTDVVADYLTITGNQDVGAYVHEVLDYRRKVGMLDANGNRHKIDAYIRLDNLDEVRTAIYLFSAAAIGFLVTNTAMRQFQTGHTWHPSICPETTLGGHYVPLIGYGPNRLYCVTWGKIQPMSEKFFRTYVDEMWAILCLDMLGADGVTAEGFNVEQLRSDLASL